MPINKKIGFKSLLEKETFNLVNAIRRFANNEPNNQGKGR
jgi:hypothetical protein